jgi:hypothetical protein
MTWNKESLLNNVEETLGAEWLNYVCTDLVSIVVDDKVKGCYDSRQRVVFINSLQSESEATQQFIMELSNHQNRTYFGEIDASVGTVSRDAYIELIERLEFAGVQNVIRSYDKAVQLRLGWAGGGCVYGAMRGKTFEQYYPHVSAEHREVYGLRYDKLRGG